MFANAVATQAFWAGHLLSSKLHHRRPWNYVGIPLWEPPFPEEREISVKRPWQGRQSKALWLQLVSPPSLPPHSHFPLLLLTKQKFPRKTIEFFSLKYKRTLEVCMLPVTNGQFRVMGISIGYDYFCGPGFTFTTLYSDPPDLYSVTPLPHIWPQELSLASEEASTTPFKCLPWQSQTHKAKAAAFCLLGLGCGPLLDLHLYKPSLVVQAFFSELAGLAGWVFPWGRSPLFFSSNYIFYFSFPCLLLLTVALHKSEHR